MAHTDRMKLFSRRDLDRIASLGTLLNAEPITAWSDPRAPALLATADVVLGHWGCPPLDSDMLALAPNLGLFAYAAGTVKSVVSDGLWQRDIRVTSGALANAEPVAEFTLASIFFANKRVFWRAGGPFALDDVAQNAQLGNYNRTIGLVGASMVGRRVIELLKPFPHLRVTLYDPFVTLEQANALGVEKQGLNELCAGCDVLSIHAPELPSTRHMIGPDQLALLKDGAVVINTARGSLLDHDALGVHAGEGRILAVLDVTDPEPLPDDHPLRAMPNVVLTPHLAGSQGSEVKRMTEYVIDEIARWSRNQPAANEVTKDQLDRIA